MVFRLGRIFGRGGAGKGEFSGSSKGIKEGFGFSGYREGRRV